MLILGDRKFIESPFDSEDEIERVVIANSESIFGPSSIYLSRALIRTKEGFGTIPDGFAIDLASRRWFIVEAELAKHSVWSHIAPQIAKQVIAAKSPASRQLVVDLAVEKVREDTTLLDKFAEEDIDVIDIRLVLGEILQGNPIVGIPIDRITSDLGEWASTLNVTVNLWTVRKYVEFGRAENVMYGLPEEFKPALDTEEAGPSDSRNARYDVTLADLIRARLLQPGEKIFMPWKPRNGDRKVFEGTIQPDGEIEVLGKVFSSPSYAAVYALQSAGSSRSTENGWLKWKNSGGL